MRSGDRTTYSPTRQRSGFSLRALRAGDGLARIAISSHLGLVTIGQSNDPCPEFWVKIF